MSEMRCDRVRALLPERAAGRLATAEAEAVEVHLRGCQACAAEAELVALLRAGRPRAPAGLASRIRAAVEADAGRGAASGTAPPAPSHGSRGGGLAFPWWGLAAAAVAAVALGIGVDVRTDVTTGGPVEVPAFAREADDALWVSGDGEIAGAPSLEDLSDEALQTFLDELSSGGAA